MDIFKIVYIEVDSINLVMDKVNDDEDFYYQYKNLDGSNELEVETEEYNLNKLKQLDIITQREYNKILEEQVSFIYLY